MNVSVNGSDIAKSLLGQAYTNRLQSSDTKIGVDTETAGFVPGDKATGMLSGASFQAFFNRDFSANRKVYTNLANEIATKAANDFGGIDPMEMKAAFENNFAFSKLTGAPITEGALAHFFDQQLENKAAADVKAANPKFSILSWFRSCFANKPLSTAQQVNNATKKADKHRKQSAQNSAATIANTDQIGDQRKDFVLGTLAEKISKDSAYSFKAYLTETEKEGKGKLTTGERGIINALSNHAQGNFDFSLALNACFHGTTDSIKDAKTPEAKEAATKTELTRLYNVATGKG